MSEVLDAPKLSAVKVYNPIEAGIALMLEKHGHVLTTPPVVTNDPKALAQAKTDRRELVKFRTTLEAARKAEKAESLAYGRLVDSEAARIQGFADPIEIAYSKAIDDEEARIESEAAALREADRLRLEAIQTRIADIKGYIVLAAECRTSSQVEELIQKLVALPTDGFEEFESVALEARTATITRLQAISDAKFEEEAEAKRIKAEQEAEAARLQEERLANEAAAAKLEVERKAAADAQAAQQAENDKKAAALEAQRVESERAQAAAQTKLDDDRKAFEQRQADAEAANKAEAERLAAKRIALEEKPEPALAIIAPAAIEMMAEQHADDTPSAALLVKAIAFEFGVELHTAAEWIERRIDDIRTFNA